MRRNLLLTLLLIPTLLLGCASKESPPEQAATANAHNSRNSLDWPGTYSGVVPCASCPGIETRITLHADGRYDRSTLYLGEGSAAIKDSGSFVWNDAGSKVTIGKGNDMQQYQVGENQLFHLDVSGERIRGELAEQYTLRRLNAQ